MTNYKQVIERAELALNNGEYKNCINLLNPLLEDCPISMNEGINVRMMLITALSGINKREESIKLCKQLIKSKNTQVREEAKSLIQILNSPDLKIPDNWNIKFETSFIDNSFDCPTPKKATIKPQKYINISNLPTGETKPFKKGFILATIIILIIVITLLSGCVKVENNLDLREINAINFDIKISSKYTNKMPWQYNFENKLREISLAKEIHVDNENFELKKNDLDIKQTNFYINKVLNITSEIIDIDLKNFLIAQHNKNFFLGKKYFYTISLDLTNLGNIDNLEIFINIINPPNIRILDDSKNINLINKNINWKLLPGENNKIKFSFWEWNKSLIGTLFVLLLIIFSYYIRQKKYELGSKLPQLPS